MFVTASDDEQMLTKVLDLNQFFVGLKKLDSDVDFQDDVAEVERALAEPLAEEAAGLRLGDGAILDGTLKVAAIAGKLVFKVDSAYGSGPCNKKGAGGFKGSPVPSGLTGGGKYELVIGRIKAKLILYNQDSSTAYTYKGYGLEKGISGTWTGTWSE